MVEICQDHPAGSNTGISLRDFASSGLPLSHPPPPSHPSLRRPAAGRGQGKADGLSQQIPGVVLHFPSTNKVVSPQRRQATLLGSRTTLSADWRLKNLPEPSREGPSAPSLPSPAPVCQGDVAGRLPPKILMSQRHDVPLTPPVLGPSLSACQSRSNSQWVPIRPESKAAAPREEGVAIRKPSLPHGTLPAALSGLLAPKVL